MSEYESVKIVLKLKIISVIFGLGSWIAITGFWVELPVLIARLPEGWKLAAYLNVMIQAANIGPLVYYFLRKWNWCSEVMAVHIQMALGVVSCVFLVTHWHYTLYVFGQQRSVVLLTAAFGLALVDCTSSVTFLPFMARFRNSYLTPYLIGEGLSGFIPTIVALLQGVDDANNQCSNKTGLNMTENMFNSASATTDGHNLAFGAEVFFSSLLATLVLSWVSFLYLLYSTVAKRETRYNQREVRIKEDCSPCLRQDIEMNEFVARSALESNIKLDKTNATLENETLSNCVQNITSNDHRELSRKQFWCFQTLMGFCCLTTFGIMPPLQPYSSLPFGNTTLHLAVVFAGLSYPFGCFLAMVIKFQRLRSDQFIYILTVIGTLFAIYLLIASSMSPNPPLLKRNKYLGSFVIIMSWTIFTLTLSYVKTVVTQILNDYGGNEALFWVGMFTQIGSAFGAAFMFLAVDYWSWFNDACSNSY